jgi:predicted ABC-type transport system involved in lysophospholipase L1 biosynthesis ATPase subunit
MNNDAKQKNNAGGDMLIEARALDKRYRMGHVDVQVLRDVSLKVCKGETLSIMGASGAGKTTLLNILGGLDRPTGGSVFFRGEDLFGMSGKQRTRIRSVDVGFVFQSYYLLPELDVLENVMVPAWSRRGALREMPAIRARAMNLLDSVGLSDRADHLPAELSGGEQQRAALARSLINDPELVLSDEPTGNLDSETGEQVLEYLFKLIKDAGHSLILVSHNRVIADRCSRTLFLQDGCLVSADG